MRAVPDGVQAPANTIVTDPGIHDARALVIDGNAQWRQLSVAQLRSLGVARVAQAQRASDARRLIEQQPYDIVLCARDIEGGAETFKGRGSGQDLLDELRRENQLPHGTVLLMTTSQVAYHHVMEAAESLLDGLLVRPFSTEVLARRLREARHRKRELAELHLALDEGRTGQALVLALARHEKQRPYAPYCGRLAAELLFNEGRHSEAQKLFAALAGGAGASWAPLGVARAQWAAGDENGARQTLAAVLAADANCADAHDLLGRIHVDKCEFDPAWQAYRRAAEITPGCLLRTQHAGALAFYQGRRDEALVWLERALALGVESKLFDALSLLLVALLRHDKREGAGVVQMLAELTRLCRRYPQSPRLQRLHAAALTLQQLHTGDDAEALDGLRRLSAQAGDDDFDLEAACTVLALWARLPPGLGDAGEHTALVKRVALRFCVSRAFAEVLLAVASSGDWLDRAAADGTADADPAAQQQRADQAVQTVRDCQAQVSALSEHALEQAMAGAAIGAAQALLAEGTRSLNAKLLQLAVTITGRYGQGQAGSGELQARAQALLQRSCRAANHIAGIHRSGRSPGGLQLRGPAAAGATAAPAAPAASQAAGATGAHTGTVISSS